MSTKTLTFEEKLNKEKVFFDDILESERSQCPNGCLHIGFWDKELQFLHQHPSVMTRYQRYQFMLEHGKEPTKEELRQWFEGLVQDHVVGSRIDTLGKEIGDGVYLTLHIARVVAFMKGTQLWKGTFADLQNQISNSFQFGLFTIIPWFPSADSLKIAMDSMEKALATLGICVERSRTFDSDELTLENLNFSEPDETDFETPSLEERIIH